MKHHIEIITSLPEDEIVVKVNNKSYEHYDRYVKFWEIVRDEKLIDWEKRIEINNELERIFGKRTTL